MITNVHAEVHCWGGKDVVCLRWDWNGRPIGGRWGIVLDGSGKHYTRPSGLSAEDKALAESLGAKTVADAKRVLAAKENQALRESVRRAKV